MSDIMGDMTQPQDDDHHTVELIHPNGIRTRMSREAFEDAVADGEALTEYLNHAMAELETETLHDPDLCECAETDCPALGLRPTPTGVLVSTAAPGTPGWHAARLDGITATDLPQILDLNDTGDPDQVGNRYGNALLVWATKTGRHTDTTAGEAALWGTIHEPGIADRWAQLNDTTVRPVGVIAHYLNRWQRCSLDRIVDDCPDGDGPCSLEIKTRSAFKAGVFRDDVPDDVLAQVLWQLIVSGYQHSHVAVLIGGNQLRSFRVDRDPVVEAHLIRGAETVWGHVHADSPPEVDPSPLLLGILDALHPDREGHTDVPAETWEALAAEQAAAAAEVKAAKARQATAKAAIVAALGDGDTLTVGGRPVVTYGLISRRGYTVEPTTYRQLKGVKTDG